MKLQGKTALTLLCLSGLYFLGLAFQNPEEGIEEKIHRYFEHEVEALHLSYVQLESLVAKNPIPVELQLAYAKCRTHYKRLECFSIYFTEQTEQELNGPLLIEVEEADPLRQELPPQGLQVIEEILFADSLDLTLLKAELARTRGPVNKLRQLVLTQAFQHWQIFEMMRLEVLRIMSLGLNNFDSPYRGASLQESAYALESLKEICLFYNDSWKKQNWSGRKALFKQFKQAIASLKKAQGIADFNHLNAIKTELLPLFASLKKGQDALSLSLLDIPRPLHGEALSPFDSGAFNPYFFSPSGGDFTATRQAQIELGKALFFDPVLSGNQERSCASCHKPEMAFSDAQTRSENFRSDAQLGRNTPSLLNVAFQQSFFWDGRVSSLEEQVKDVTLNPSELHGNFDTAALRLKTSEAYRKLFQAAFSNSSYAQINGASIQKAIAAYERSLIALNSPFDQYMRGDLKKLPAKAQAGFNLFMGKALCSTCHFFPLFNGTVPPHYRKTENEVLGIAQSADNKKLDQDSGKLLITLTPLHLRSFKTPGLRNLGQTAPYMHNGAYPDLNSVIDFYNRGGGQGLGFEVHNQTLPSDSLALTSIEVDALISFLETLHDTTSRFPVPAELPAIPGSPERRKIGGAY